MHLRGIIDLFMTLYQLSMSVFDVLEMGPKYQPSFCCICQQIEQILLILPFGLIAF